MSVCSNCWCSRKTWVMITVELSLTIVAKHREMGPWVATATVGIVTITGFLQ